MNLYPKSWIFPYRKVQEKETICKAGLRALREDTGVNIFESPVGYSLNNSKVELRPLCLYESIFPKELEYGLPTNQGMLFFFEVLLPWSSNDLNLKKTDVDYLVWVSNEEWKDIQNGSRGKLTAEGKETKIDYRSLQGIAPNFLGEGISEGHFIALSIVFNNDSI